MPFQFMAKHRPDRRAREKAIIDTVWMNHLSDTQDFNGLTAEALYLAMPAGFCPVHAYWRDDPYDEHEPVTHGLDGQAHFELFPNVLTTFLLNILDFGHAFADYLSIRL